MSSAEKPGDKSIRNWTKFPNCILDNLEKFTPTEFMVLALMVRKNIGYNDPSQMFSVRYISKKLGMDTKTVTKVITALLEKESIRVTKIGTRGVRYFDINWIEPKPEKQIEEIKSDSEQNDRGKISTGDCRKISHSDCRKISHSHCRKISHSDCRKISHDYKTDKNKKTTTDKNAETQPPLSPEKFGTEHEILVSLIPESMRDPVIISLVEKYHRSHGFEHVADCIVYTNQRPRREDNGTRQAYRGYLSKGLAGQYEGISGLYASVNNGKNKKKSEKEEILNSVFKKKVLIMNDGKRYDIIEGFVENFDFTDKETGKLHRSFLIPDQIANIVLAGKAGLE